MENKKCHTPIQEVSIVAEHKDFIANSENYSSKLAVSVDEEKCTCGWYKKQCEADYRENENILNPTPPQTIGWDNGQLTFDRIKNILEVCNVNDVEIKQDSLSISFVPKNATGQVWQNLKEKMHQIISK